ncbi:hypothetical protein EZL74_12865 [Flavobacterium silvisoli]|uniref:KAP NTPase domain-containing protein n=1 Tax=Flavobacterium silvisoli TaxID=2529433 RepID=A0A4Q9YQP7_9FLAO|nr:P-loop NTPase fold protein [Flavobacterium silvisoli]TBX64774.1 hypothetical protein EZL74_12865 [Flavobacterium silvisoli]
MQSKYIEEIFEDYLKTPKTQYAILINGSWGSGKTYFFKNNLTEIATKQQFKTIYLTLNGLNKIDDFRYQFLIKLVPSLNILDSSKSGVFKTILTAAAQKFGSINLNDILKDIEIDASKLTNFVVCFDDLERCSIPKEEVLGFINNYVEHKNLKVLILSDETKIKGNEIYNNIKEKVIGRILNYKNNLDKTLPLLLAKYKTDQEDFYQAVDNKKEYILELLTTFKEENLRNISFYLSVLSKLYPEAKKFPEYWKEVILFSLIMTIEFKNGNFTSNDYKSFKGLDEIDTTYSFFGRANTIDFSLSPEERKEEESETEKFYNKYVVNNFSDFHFFKSIYVFILTGYLDKTLLNEELTARYPVVISDEIKVFREIISAGFRSLSDIQFSQNITKLIEFAEEGKYPIYDYISIANYLVYFSKRGLIELPIEKIQELLLKGVEKSSQSKAINNHLYRTMLHFKHSSDESTIWEAVKKAHETIAKEKEKEKVSALLEAVKDNNATSIGSVFSDYIANPELFVLLNPDELVNALLLTTNEVIQEFTLQVQSRYSASNIRDYLNLDTSFLETLSAKLEEKIKTGIEGKVRAFIISELIEAISEILPKIK